MIQNLNVYFKIHIYNLGTLALQLLPNHPTLFRLGTTNIIV